MNTCQPHWDMMRAGIEEAGLSDLVAKSGEEAFANIVTELGVEPGSSAPFDPLMSMHWHFSSISMQAFGLQMLIQKEDGSMPCYMCELENCYTEFDPKTQIDSVAGQMLEYCKTEGLIKVN